MLLSWVWRFNTVVPRVCWPLVSTEIILGSKVTRSSRKRQPACVHFPLQRPNSSAMAASKVWVLSQECSQYMMPSRPSSFK